MRGGLKLIKIESIIRAQSQIVRESMPWAINISRENQRIKIILEGIEYKLFAKHVEKIAFQNWTIALPYFPDLRLYSARSSEYPTKHLSQLQIDCPASKLKPRFEDSESRMRRISELYMCLSLASWRIRSIDSLRQMPHPQLSRDPPARPCCLQSRQWYQARLWLHARVAHGALAGRIDARRDNISRGSREDV
jgi:hypothetical protein